MQAGRLYNLQSPVQREIAGSLVRQNSEIQDGGSRALNQVQGPSEWGPVWPWSRRMHTQEVALDEGHLTYNKQKYSLVPQASLDLDLKQN